MNRLLAVIALGAVLSLWSCNSEGTGPVAVPSLPCEDADTLKLGRLSVTAHKSVKKVKGVDTALTGMTWTQGEAVKSFFGGKDVKLVFTLDRRLFLVSYVDGVPTLTRISKGDEGRNGALGSINSPLISPDGKRVVFAGTTLGKPGFIQELATGSADSVNRVPLDRKARVTADPHWHTEGGKTFVYFATAAGVVSYSNECGQIQGSTYRVEVTGDTSLGEFEATGIPGAYRGGISRDGAWAGTSYAKSALFNRNLDTTILIGGEEQQCNPSMNAFPVGSRNMDYMLILAFGGANYTTITGKPITELQHENLWIYNQDDKIVWQAKRPDEALYRNFDKPEWSTHPQYASAVAIRKAGDGDLYIIRVGDLANAVPDSIIQSEGYLKIATGRFNSDSYSHLWVAP